MPRAPWRGTLATMTAPVEYVIIAFPGNRFSGEIGPALAELVADGTVHIIDLVFIKKDEDGEVTIFEMESLDEAGDLSLDELEGEAGGLLNDEDLELAAAALEPDSSAALIVWEQLWAARIAEAIRNADGQILAGERIPHDIVQAAMADL
jgi:Family of unknown function (DUF6325)